jgi:hypothetical protein
MPAAGVSQNGSSIPLMVWPRVSGRACGIHARRRIFLITADEEAGQEKDRE